MEVVDDGNDDRVGGGRLRGSPAVDTLGAGLRRKTIAAFILFLGDTYLPNDCSGE